MAATFCDLEAGRAVRVAAKESSKERARELHPDLDKRAARMLAYRDLADEELFDTCWVRVPIGPEEMPGFKSERTACAECGEGISFRREVLRDGRILCKSCAGEQYWEPA
jgi:formylmethanofuran dehydrogenase subunit E